MNGVLPLLRTFEPTVRSSWSRIPHIKAHILQRRAHSLPPPLPQGPLSTRPKASKSGRTCTARHASTVASSRGEEVETEPEGNTAPEKEPVWPLSGINAFDATEASQEQEALQQQQLRSSSALAFMKEFVEEGHPERVLRALLHPHIGAPFIRDASDQDFAHAFELLDPIHFLGERKKISRDIHVRLHIRFKIRKAVLLAEKFDWYLGRLEDILAHRRRSGHPPTLEVYRQLLKWAEVVGSESLARDLFDSAMPQDGIVPDLSSYNSYLGACVWNGAYDVDFKYKRRNIPLNLKFRERILAPKNSQYFLHLGRHRYERPEDDTVRGHCLSVFGELTKRGHKPDEATFVNLMLAMAYDGDINGIKSVLKSVWNIDVDMLDQYDEEEIESPTFYEENDPLRPSPKLLHAIVYAFGTNNDAFHASFLLDYISRNYNLPIPSDIWMLVYEFTYVLAQKFSAARERQGQGVGKLPEGSLAKYFDMIADEPHNVKPNTWMLAKLTNNARRARGNLDKTVQAFQTALRLRDEQMTRISQLYDDMLDICHGLNLKASDVPPAEFLDTRRTYIHETLKLDRDLEALRQEMRQILRNNPWQFNISPWQDDRWCVRTVPYLIQEYLSFMPEQVTVGAPRFRYTIENGRWHRERAITDSNGQFDIKTAKLRNILEEEDTDLLMKKARHAKKFIDMTERTCLVCKKEGDHRSEDCPRWEVGLAGYGLKYGVEELKLVDPHDSLESETSNMLEGQQHSPGPDAYKTPEERQQQQQVWRKSISGEGKTPYTF